MAGLKNASRTASALHNEDISLAVSSSAYSLASSSGIRCSMSLSSIFGKETLMLKPSFSLSSK
ncbi:MAG: hypothetical protein SPK73_05425 [Eubacteriales bacterium]|nr:hypothetical protein [Eubacteriales bacterium]